MAEQLSTYDPADALDSEEAIAVFMVDAFETGDAAYAVKALGVVARAKRMMQIAEKAGLSYEQLHHSFSQNEGPTLKTIFAVMKAIGVDITAKIHA